MERAGIPERYKKYELEEDIPEALSVGRDRFRQVMSSLGAIYTADELSGTNWTRPPLFYSLFCAIAHARFGLTQSTGGREPLSPARPALGADSVARWRGVLDEISARFDLYTEDENEAPADYLRFITNWAR